MMMDWNDYRRQLGAALGDIASVSPETVRGDRIMAEAGKDTGRLDPKTRELIALAVAVTAHCDGCITVYTDAAVREGATKDEIAETLGVAIAANAGAAMSYSARALDAYKARISEGVQEAAASGARQT